MVQAACEASRCGKDADHPSANPFYKDATDTVDAVGCATTPLLEN